MQNELILGTNFLIHQKVSNVGALVSRELDDLAQLVVLDNGTVAAKVLLERLEDAFDVQIIGETLECRDTLSTISLLDSNMDFTSTYTRRITCICKVI